MEVSNILVCSRNELDMLCALPDFVFLSPLYIPVRFPVINMDGSRTFRLFVQ